MDNRDYNNIWRHLDDVFNFDLSATPHFLSIVSKMIQEYKFKYSYQIWIHTNTELMV